jgi:Mg2+/citrate symporter
MLQLLSLVGNLGVEWIKGKQEEAKVKHEVKLKQLQSTENWEAMQAQASQNSWKDEWFAVILSVPLIGAFIPDLVPYIQQGFTVLDSMPDYYKAFLAAAISASFGLKAVSQWKK